MGLFSGSSCKELLAPHRNQGGSIATSGETWPGFKQRPVRRCGEMLNITLWCTCQPNLATRKDVFLNKNCGAISLPVWRPCITSLRAFSSLQWCQDAIYWVKANPRCRAAQRLLVHDSLSKHFKEMRINAYEYMFALYKHIQCQVE